MEFYKINAINNETIKLKEWFWKQMEASIRTIFLKYGFDFPEIVFVQEFDHLVVVQIMRPNFDTLEDAAKWQKSRVYILDELSLQAEANSTDEYDGENYLTYTFKII